MSTIRTATKEDMPRVLELITELAVFENEPNAVEITLKDLQDDGFGASKKFICFVAEYDNAIQGMALVYLRYSTWKGTALHLEDLIVSKAYRGKGIGTELLNQVIIHGKELNVKRIGWEVLNWNTKAIEFYNKKGATILEDWHVVQLNENAINTYIKAL